MKVATLEEFHAALQAQGLPLQHVVMRCPVCATLQSPQDLIDAGAGHDYESVRRFIGYSCVGRWTGATFNRRGKVTGYGCDWTFGGIFEVRTYLVQTHDGRLHPVFEPVSPPEAHEHRQRGHRFHPKPPARFGVPHRLAYSR
jgi:hypothetical protein